MSLLDIRDLSVTVATPRGTVPVVRGLGFTLAPGQTLGIVGESGSGKSMTALAIMGLLPEGASASGTISFKNEDLLAAAEARLCALRGNRLAMIFQEPMTSLNPVHRVGDQVAEPLLLHRRITRAEAWDEAVSLLAHVGIPDAPARARAYPHELSGGQRQRAMIAMALACAPDLLIADEPTSALDATVQAQIVRLLRARLAESGAALILISHDLGVVGQLADRVLVMYGGRVVEEGPAQTLFRNPAHPYTQALLASIPTRAARKGRRLAAIPGVVPAPWDLPSGCPFRTRCPKAADICAAPPPAIAVGAGHTAWCVIAEKRS